jgi:2-keto-3-deoxy-L-fuconate dehydrogenase
MTARLAGKTAFVTAAGQGIGRATALAFAAEGARVIATDVNEALLAKLGNASISTAKLDATDADAIAAAAAKAGPVDILFNCAGVVHHGTVLDATEAEWDFAFTLNVRSMFRTIRAFLPAMLAKGGGSIAIIGLSRSVAADYVTQGVRSNCICPGTIQTPSLDQRIAGQAAAAGSVEAARAAFVARQAMGRLGTPEEIAALAVYLASDEAQFVTGQAIVIDGGWTL